MEIDLNTKDTDEYKQWLELLREIRAIHETLQNEPNSKGLKLARSLAYNILADIHSLIDQVDTLETGGDDTKDSLGSNSNSIN